LGLLLALSLVLTTGAALAETGGTAATYHVTIQNLATGQPLSPPVVATHQRGISMFTVGNRAIPELESIAEGGNQIPMLEMFQASALTTSAIDIGMPLTPAGTTVGGFSDSVSFVIEAQPGDRLSMATMLICTNDGFTGLDAAHLPAHGSRVYLIAGYDAGSEDNTEASTDIVDPCSALGPMPLVGDPNGNEDAAVDTQPPQAIAHHPGIAGGADLDAGAHGWTGPIAKVTVTRVDPGATEFMASLSGAAEVPPVHTEARGGAGFSLNGDETDLSYVVKVGRIDNVTQAHIHLGSPDENGPVVAFLYGPADPSGPLDGLLASGSLEEADLLGPLAGDFNGFVEALRAGDLYVNVHTTDVPSGEIRGQIGAVGN
jgi:hypothetical protein